MVNLRILALITALSLGLSVPQAQAALAVVDSTGGAEIGSDGTPSYGFGTVTAGNLLICGGSAWNGSSMTAVTATDSVGTTYSGIMGAVKPSGIPDRPWVVYGIAGGTGANTATINLNGGTYSSATCIEVSGNHASPLDVDGGSSTGTSTTPADSVTTSAADTIVVGVMTVNGGAAFAPDTGAGWIEAGEIESTSNSPSSMIYQIFSSAGAKTPTWTTSNDPWSAMSVSFKAAAGGGASQTFGFRKRLPQ